MFAIRALARARPGVYERPSLTNPYQVSQRKASNALLFTCYPERCSSSFLFFPCENDRVHAFGSITPPPLRPHVGLSDVKTAENNDDNSIDWLHEASIPGYNTRVGDVPGRG